jgi:6-phosphogluconate dehydrogenase
MTGSELTCKENKIMAKQKYEIGKVSPGVMEHDLVQNIADHGYSVSGYDKDLSKVQELKKETGSRAINAAQSLQKYISRKLMDKFHIPNH